MPFAVGILASARVPGAMIVQSMDVAVALREGPTTLASGFHSPVERECLKYMLNGLVPLIVCPARSAIDMRIPAAWKAAVATNRLAIRSAIDEGFEAQHHASQPGKEPRRPTKTLAEHRNRFVAAISDAVLILHATQRGKLDRFASDILATHSKPVWTLDDPANLRLIQQEARPVTATTIGSIWADV